YFFFLRILPPPRPTLFPYTTLFRSMSRSAFRRFSSIESLSASGSKHPSADKAVRMACIGRVSGGNFLMISTTPLGSSRYHQEISDRKSTRLNSSHDQISYAVFCLKK